jgi:hypothetical protein
MLGRRPSNATTERTLLDSPDIYYRLIEVGAIRSQQANNLEPDALVSFKATQFDGTIIPNAEIIVQPLPMQFAASFVPGSIWSANGEFISEGGHIYSERRTLKIGKRVPILKRLSQLSPSKTNLPEVLQIASPDTWYAVFNTGIEKIIIPCFELLRAFCYQDARGLSNYFFSRLSLDMLCWPIAEPTSVNGFTAHFCIASTLRRMHEANVLAELLFNSDYRNTVQAAHAYLATAWHKCKANRKIPQSYAKTHFKLGRDVTTEAYGTSFILGNQKYFWVSRLIPPDNWYGFKKVVYHPLQSSSDASLSNHPFPDMPQWAFRDVLQGRRPTPKTTPVPELPNSFQHFGRGRQNISFVSGSKAPQVVQSFAWAMRIAATQPPLFADKSILEHLWARPNYIPNNKELTLPENVVFQQLSTCLRELGCSVSPVEVNNPAGRFGSGHSIIPYARAPGLDTHLPDCRHRPMSIARIKWGGGNFYLFNFLESKKIVLCYQKSLIRLSNKECNDILLSAVNDNFDWNSIDRTLPYAENYYIRICQFRDELSWMAENIFFVLQDAISSFNRDADFKSQTANLNLDMRDLYKADSMIYNILKTLNKRYYAGNYIGEKFTQKE